MDPETTPDYWKILDIMFSVRTRRPSVLPSLWHGQLDLSPRRVAQLAQSVESQKTDTWLMLQLTSARRRNFLDLIPIHDGGLRLRRGLELIPEIDIRHPGFQFKLRMPFQ